MKEYNTADFVGEEQDIWFYHKNSKGTIVPVLDKNKNSVAKKKLDQIYAAHKNEVPKIFLDNWHKVKLFDQKGNAEMAHSLIMNPKEGAYDLKNKLNHLTGKAWTLFTCSWFVFNALPKDLKEEREFCKNLQEHPATYSPTMMEQFINFFTKEGMSVLDPFCGIGSTLVGCKRTGRIGYGVELNKKYFDLAVRRVPEFKENVFCGDSRNIKQYFKNKKFDFCISSPPYWDVLNRSTKDFKKERDQKGLDINYSESNDDLGNMGDYTQFLDSVTGIYLDAYDLLRNGAYLVVIVKNVKKDGKFYPLAWDIGKTLTKKYILTDEKIWIQDQIRLAPYGYPYAWTSNILHHYCLILKKEV